MLSGQGRHRRPRQAPAIVVAAGVTGSAIAIPLLGATGASAADATTWDKVAECESGGAWSAKGDGYYGGLQMTQETWEDYGGLAYAPSADEASRSQQIAVADAVLADQGPAAWPNCGPAAGLSKDDAAADVDPGLPVTPSKPSGSSGSSGSSDDADGTGRDGKGSSDSKGSTDARDKDHADGKSGEGASDERTGKHRKPGSGDATGEAGTSGPSGEKSDGRNGEGGEGGDQDGQDAGRDGKSEGRDSTSPGAGDDSGADGTPSGSEGTDDASGDAAESSEGTSGRHRGPSADEDAAGDSAAGSAGRHASRGGDRDSRGPGSAADTYTVRSGDNLSRIADRHDLDGGWSSLYAGNKKTVGADPDLILPGQELELKEKQAAEADGK
ncbi:LysM peptidoglycan-binding domain-containing protein [Streptomyces sp. p1417]|uniref:LysM peptidoglycan-binding domain-containing protein n=1 Tax=Streptomyces typhae TaxID=2681492 RepID=A0A6L6WWQ8_9ACTN|nr:transglycosylase family protein [Streptomyces typhae]MVO85924.1 LysM peptidoglycan-binding domain-containing protein [Streptomyces typhae]